jgi:peroxiredoxin
MGRIARLGAVLAGAMLAWPARGAAPPPAGRGVLSPPAAMALLRENEARVVAGVVRYASTSRSTRWDGDVDEGEARAELAARGRDYGGVSGRLQFAGDAWRDDAVFTSPAGVSLIMETAAAAGLRRELRRAASRMRAVVGPEGAGPGNLVSSLLRARLGALLKDVPWKSAAPAPGGRVSLKAEWQGRGLELVLDPRAAGRVTRITVLTRRDGQERPSAIVVVEATWQTLDGLSFPARVSELRVSRLGEGVQASRQDLRVETALLNGPVAPAELLVALPPGAEVTDLRAGTAVRYSQGERDLSLAEVRDLAEKKSSALLPTPPGGPRLGAPAPPLAVRTLDGKPAGLADFRGKVVLLNWFASWCPACHAEAPRLEEFWDQYRDRGLVVVGIDNGEQPGADRPALARAFASRHGLTYPLWIDAEDRSLETYGGDGFPTNALVDRDGTLRYAASGFDEATLSRLLEQLLKPAAPAAGP